SKDGRNLTDVLFLRQHTQKRAILESLDDFVQSCVRGITSSQLRKLYDLVIGAKQAGEIQIQRPQFAYLIARQPNEEARKLMILVDELAKRVTDKDTVNDFKWVFEAIVSFHKYHEALTDRRARYPADKIVNNLRKDIAIEDLLKVHQQKNVQKIEQLLDQLEKFIEGIVRHLTTTQIRRVYDKILAVQSAEEVSLLRPFLAYTTARQEREGGVKMMLLLLELSKTFNEESQTLVAFKKVVEIILSIHKYYDTTKGRSESDKILLKKVYRDYFGEKATNQDLLHGVSDYQDFQKKLQKLILNNLDGLNTAQLRKLYDEVQPIQSDELEELHLKRPLFLYLAGRQNDNRAKRISLFLNDLIKATTDKEKLKRFQQIMEDVVAYHKYYDTVKLLKQEIA
ncbi:MAG: type III-A CRISPR-associated protein Csm2, partial [Bacteroidota bacterium]